MAQQSGMIAEGASRRVGAPQAQAMGGPTWGLGERRELPCGAANEFFGIQG